MIVWTNLKRKLFLYLLKIQLPLQMRCNLNWFNKKNHRANIYFLQNEKVIERIRTKRDRRWFAIK